MPRQKSKKSTIVILSLTSCEKGKEGDLPNTLKVGNKTYTLGAACCYSYEINGINKYNLFLAHKTIWNNIGDWVSSSQTYANGSSLDELPDGNYAYGDEYKDHTHSGDSDYMFYDNNGKPGRWIDMGQDYVKTSKLAIEVKHISDKIYEIKFTGPVDFYRPR